MHKTHHLQKLNRIRSKSTFFLFFMQCRHFASGTHTQFLFTYRFYSLDTSVCLQEVYVYIYVCVCIHVYYVSSRTTAIWKLLEPDEVRYIHIYSITEESHCPASTVRQGVYIISRRYYFVTGNKINSSINELYTIKIRQIINVTI